MVWFTSSGHGSISGRRDFIKSCGTWTRMLSDLQDMYGTNNMKFQLAVSHHYVISGDRISVLRFCVKVFIDIHTWDTHIWLDPLWKSCYLFHQDFSNFPIWCDFSPMLVIRLSAQSRMPWFKFLFGVEKMHFYWFSYVFYFVVYCSTTAISAT